MCIDVVWCGIVNSVATCCFTCTLDCGMYIGLWLFTGLAFDWLSVLV